MSSRSSHGSVGKSVGPDRHQDGRQGVCNVLTVDVEDWYHCLDPERKNWRRYEDRIAGSTRRLLEILRAADTRATFFVLGYVAENHPELVRELAAEGHEVASHGCDHEFIYKQTPKQFEEDIRKSLDLIQNLVDQPILGYRAPYFSITRKSYWALSVLREAGFAYDSSIFPVHNHRYGIPDAPRLIHRIKEDFWEVPLTTFPLAGVNIPFCGGVYFRFSPYPMVRQIFRSLNRGGTPVVFYLHPWELDADQPRIALPRFLKFRHYWGLDRTAEKLQQLLSEFRFEPVREALGL